MVEDENMHSEIYIGPYQETLSKHISWNDLIRSYTINQVRFNNITLESMPENAFLTSDYQSLLSNRYFLNILHRRATICMISNQETNVLIDKAHQIIQLIDNDLEK